MTTHLSDGRPLDDAQPQDMARELSGMFEKLGHFLEGGGPEDDEQRAVLVEEMRRATAVMKLWAEFGRWPKHFRVERVKDLIDTLIADSYNHGVIDEGGRGDAIKHGYEVTATRRRLLESLGIRE